MPTEKSCASAFPARMYTQFGRGRKSSARIKQPEYMTDVMETYRRKQCTCIWHATERWGWGSFSSVCHTAIGRVNPRHIENSGRWDVKVWRANVGTHTLTYPTHCTCHIHFPCTRPLKRSSYVILQLYSIFPAVSRMYTQCQ